MSPEVRREFIQPVSPEGLNELKREMMPPEVFEIFNRLIGQKALNGYAVIHQDDVVQELIERGMERSDIFSKGWLNIEPLYEEVGWKVEYDKPAYNETGPAVFRFSAKKK